MGALVGQPWILGLMGALVTALSTTVGALPAMAKREIKPRTQDILSGFSAGIMLAATAFSLILPALEMFRQHASSQIYPALSASIMVLLGGVFLHACNRWIPHEHFIKGREGGPSAAHLKRIWLFVFAIGLHNFPEGLAVGSGMGRSISKLRFQLWLASRCKISQKDSSLPQHLCPSGIREEKLFWPQLLRA